MFCSFLVRFAIPLRLPRKTTSDRQQVLRTSQFFTLLTWKCASRHNRVHFFDISTSKRGPYIAVHVVFLYIFTWKCASRHNVVNATSKSAPEAEVLCTF